MKIAFLSLGCKVNLCETEGIRRLALEAGHTEAAENADIVIMNSCCVTQTGAHKNIRALHKARQLHPHAVIAVMGCMAQTEGERLQADGTADLICGTSNRREILALCEKAAAAHAHPHIEPHFQQESNVFEPLPSGVPGTRTRALLKIEDGCDNFCSYCIIPYARGRVRSLPHHYALAEAQRLSKEGIHEIVLTGIEISSYGKDLQPEPNNPLIHLICDLCAAYPQMRYRLGSLEPRTITKEFCELLSRFPNLAPHFHLSLQSGCDATLQRMNRKYTTDAFRNAVEMLRQFFPHCSITSDVIVGFPGETEREFAQTRSFLKFISLSDLHVFPYSARSGTRAASMPDQVAEHIKTERANLLRADAEAHSRSYRLSCRGLKVTVIPEHCTQAGEWVGHGPYSFPIYIKKSFLKKNHPVIAVLTEPHLDGMAADIIDSSPVLLF